MYATKTPIDMLRFNVPQLKEFLTFSVKDNYQLNYFICIKDCNAQTITSLKLNLFSFFIYCSDCTYMNQRNMKGKRSVFIWILGMLYRTAHFIAKEIA